MWSGPKNNPDERMKNIIVSAGHGDRDPGAVAGTIIEHLHGYQIAWLLRSALEEKGHAVAFISCFQSLPEKIRAVNGLHGQKPVDLAIEIHFNSVEEPQANGTEVLFYSQKLEPVAKDMSQRLAAAIGTRDRGAKKRTDLGWLKQTQPPALIVEVLFISNPLDAIRLDDLGFHRAAAEAIAAGAM